MARILRGEIRWAELNPVRGHEQAGQRRALVVSYEAFHRSGLATVCPISARTPRYPGEVAIPEGHAGQTVDAVILYHQVRTIAIERVTRYRIGGVTQYLTAPDLRHQVREALAHHLGLDVPAVLDGAAA